MAAFALQNASLYVGDLHPDVTDTQLYELFAEFQTLMSVRVCRDTVTGRSLCYAYANFVTHQDASHALQKKNYAKLNGKAIRVSWSTRDPEIRRTGAGNVFVKNLADTIDNARLHEMFQTHGNILSCKVACAENGQSHGYGFVQFDKVESANEAIERLNGTHVEGKKLFVAKFIRRSARAETFTNVFVKNIDPAITEQEFEEKFSEFGKIVSSIITKDKNGRSKGFGFVNYENPEDAVKAVAAMNNYQLGSKVLYANRAQKKKEREQHLRRHFEELKKERELKFLQSNVYVKNIHKKTVTDEKLQEFFKSFGVIKSAKVMRDDKGRSKGFGFVCYTTPEEAKVAVESAKGAMFHGKKLFAAIAQRKADRQAMLQSKYTQQMAGYVHHVNPMYYPASAPVTGYPPQYYYQVPAAMPSPMAQLVYAQPPMPMTPIWSGYGYGAAPVADSQSLQLLRSFLAVATPEEQKQLLGDRLYPLVSQRKADLASKITGMLLEMDNSEVLMLLESADALTKKVEEAISVLERTKTNGATTSSQTYAAVLGGGAAATK